MKFLGGLPERLPELNNGNLKKTDWEKKQIERNHVHRRKGGKMTEIKRSYDKQNTKSKNAGLLFMGKFQRNMIDYLRLASRRSPKNQTFGILPRVFPRVLPE